MIWLPRTADNSTYFAQSLEIRGIESRLYSSMLQEYSAILFAFIKLLFVFQTFVLSIFERPLTQQVLLYIFQLSRHLVLVLWHMR